MRLLRIEQTEKYKEIELEESFLWFKWITIYRMYLHYSWYWQCYIPKKPRYGNYRGMGYSGRYRKILRERAKIYGEI